MKILSLVMIFYGGVGVFQGIVFFDRDELPIDVFIMVCGASVLVASLPFWAIRIASNKATFLGFRKWFWCTVPWITYAVGLAVGLVLGWTESPPVM